MVCALLIALWANAYAAMVALSVLALYASYGLPIACGFLARRSGRWSSFGPWDLGRYSPLINLLALAWIATAMVPFLLPPNQLAGSMFFALAAAVALDWRFRMRARFRGPPVAR